MKQGIEGVKMALKVLKEYYAKAADASHGAAEGAGSSIIGLLEVCESDFTKGLTEMTAEEESAAADLDKSVAELSTDLSGVTDELSAVLSALDKLKEMCVAKAEPYAERKARRESEIAGLKDALQILEQETALLQTTAKHTLRGARPHHA